MAQPGDDGTVSWVAPIQTRDGTLNTDAKMVNAFAEKEENGVALVKRPGGTYVSGSGITGTAQGQFSFQRVYYFIVNDVAYIAGSTVGPGIAIPSITQSGQAYWSLDTSNFYGTTPTVIQNEAGELWKFAGSPTPSFTKVTDANYTSAIVSPGIANLDGVYYTMRSNGQLIGSAINDPTTWPALDFVGADPSFGVGISASRHLNYIVGFYDRGLQVFWDANAAPNGSGIALQPVLSASFTTGCFNARTITRLGDITFFVSHSAQNGREVQMLNGLQLTRVSTPFIEKILNQAALLPAQANIWAFATTIAGHDFYVLTSVALNLTLAYDVTTGLWSTWSSVVNGVEQYFVGRFQIADDGNENIVGDILQDVSTGRQFVMSIANYTDATGVINVACVTPNYDWGSLYWKRFSAMFQIADTISTTIGVSFTDNDYQSFSVPRTIDLSTAHKQLRNCGSSRRRAWKMTHTDNTPLRLNDMKAQITAMKR